MNRQLVQLHMHFNSQPHEEADGLEMCSLRMQNTYFNSQPHEEADFDNPELLQEEHISTHSLTKRLTNLIPMQNYQHRTFQLTASRRG